MKQAVSILLLAAFGSLGCRGDMDRGDPSVAVDLAISPTPPAVGSARLLISLRDSLDAPLAGAIIAVEGNMSHAGMTPVQDTALAGNPGSYTVPEFHFSMAGEWFLDVEAVLPDGRQVRRRFPVHVVGNMGGGSAPSGRSDGPGRTGVGGNGPRPVPSGS
jgi:hypothetical protein